MPSIDPESTIRQLLCRVNQIKGLGSTLQIITECHSGNLCHVHPPGATILFMFRVIYPVSVLNDTSMGNLFSSGQAIH
jgi:hypothetical protein